MKEDLEKLSHSTAHLLAAAVQKLYPETLLAIGPAIENGFYYDFQFISPIGQEDLEKIESEMRKIVKNWVGFERLEVSKNEALKKFKNNPFKKELIEEFAKQNKTLTFYKSGDFIDLCKGGHVEHPNQEIKFFRLLSIAGAYWRGSEKNPMLTRIYGTVWPSKQDLENYLEDLEEARKRDHRKIGKDLKLFVFADLVGKGLPLLTAKGATIRRILERFIVDEEIKRGYQHVITPVLAKVDLFRTSGHYPYYKETMYPPMKVDEEELILRPMTCPHHFMLYKSEVHSYKELPIKLAEISPQFRYEKSGELTGLMRVRTFTLSDAHIICKTNQAKEEIKKVLDLIDYVNDKLGLQKSKDYRYRLSLGEPGDNKKYFKDDQAWKKAEQTLREVLQETKSPFFEAKDEAAFYGPKIDIQMKNALGKEETAFTIQYDFVQPKRFELSFVNENGQAERPIVIHRSSIGAIERTIAFLIEHYAGNLPVWLSPVQVEIIPIADRHLEYAKEIKDQLIDFGIRAQVNLKTEPLGAKIRSAQLEKIPYMLIIGDKEKVKKQITIRTREGQDLGTKEIAFLQNLIKKETP